MDGNDLYFTTDNYSSNCMLKKVAKGGGSVTTLVNGAALYDSGTYRGIGGSFAMDNSNIYGGYGGYVNSNIFKAPKGGGSVTNLASFSGGVFIGVSGIYLYYSDGFSFIERMSNDGSGLTTLLSGYWVRSVAMDNTGIYFVDYGTMDVKKFDLNTSSLSTLISGNSDEGGVVIDSNYVYFRLSGTIKKVSKIGGSVTTLTSGGSNIGSYVSDDTYLYFVQDNAIKKIPVSGGTISTVTTDYTSSVSSIAVDDTYLYWGDTSGGTGAGKIVRMSKSTSGGCQIQVTPFKQGYPRPWWGDNLYDHSSLFTIRQKGCALTSLAMALTAAGITQDPGSLNEFMAKTKNDYVELGVNWEPATRDASGGKLKFHQTRINSVIDLQRAMDYLDNAVCQQGYPVIVGVNLDVKGIPGHFVLVTGKQGNDFQIADPGYEKTKLSEYNNKFETRGFVADARFGFTKPIEYNNEFETRDFVSGPPGDISELDLATGDDVELLIVDPSGMRTGFDPNGGLVVEHIANSTYFRDALEDDVTGAPPTETAHLIGISRPSAGIYQIIVTGLKIGTYTLSGRVFSQDGTSQPEIIIRGIAGPASTSSFSVVFS
ncbi:MAG: C39 family peptidase [Candidatus Brocadiaceae bacterium]